MILSTFSRRCFICKHGCDERLVITISSRYQAVSRCDMYMFSVFLGCVRKLPCSVRPRGGRRQAKRSQRSTAGTGAGRYTLSTYCDIASRAMGLFGSKSSQHRTTRDGIVKCSVIGQYGTSSVHQSGIRSDRFRFHPT